MKRALNMFAAGIFILASLALWALGNNIAWSAHRILMASMTLVLIGFAIYL